MSTVKYLFLLLLFGSAHAHAQVVTNMPATTTTNESFFQYEVKLIEEFIERFNDKSDSYIRQRCRSMFGTDTMLTRGKMLKSLIDKSQGCSSDTAKFFEQVANPAHPQYLAFTDSTWYAEVKCTFTYNKHKVEMPVVLHIQTRDGASKWMIAGIGNSELTAGKPSAKAAPPAKPRTANYIPTSSYGTNFVVFTSVFSGKPEPADYFDPGVLATAKGQYFISLIRQHKVAFRYARDIKYHFYQVDGWVFTVQQFKRKGNSSGWLISHLERASAAEKGLMLTKLLYP